VECPPDARARVECELEIVQAIVQVAPKLAILHHGFEVAIGRRYQSHIDLLGSIAAEPFKLTLLQRAQELRLNIEGNISNLVEEQSASVS
jgi:hypothetical protein